MKLADLICVGAFALNSFAFADDDGPYIMTVADVRELRPGPEWNPDNDEIFVQVRGYLSGIGNLYIYSTKDQALLRDFSGVLVSDEGEGKLRERCNESFVELVARLGWMEKEKRPTLIPTEASRLILREGTRPQEVACWSSE